MPHDRRGNVLKEGDRVTITGTVRTIYEGEDACNVVVQTDDGEGDAAAEWAPQITCNSRLFEKVDPD